MQQLEDVSHPGKDIGTLNTGGTLNMSKQYMVNEIFYSLQGEGVRAGTANVFVRFTGCNLACEKETHGFSCDTEFTSGRKMTAEEIRKECERIAPACRCIVFTGGEPLLQADAELQAQFRDYYTCIETNGTIENPGGFNWVTCSPKIAEHALKCSYCSEVKYVRAYGQGVPVTKIKASNFLISPAFDGSSLDRETLAWCIKLVKENPQWRLSVQQHKQWQVR